MAIYHRTPQGDPSQAKYDASRKEEIPPILPPSPDNIAGSLTGNNKIQDVGKNLWEGEAFAEQRALKRQVGASPVPPPGDGIQQEYGGMFMQPLALKGEMYSRELNKKHTEEKTLADKHMEQYKSAKTDKEKKEVVMHSELHGDESINN